MLTNPYIRLVTVLFPLTLTLTGCHLFPCKGKKAPIVVEPVPVQVSVVQVGGIVARAGSFQLVDGAENLSAVLSIVGVESHPVLTTARVGNSEKAHAIIGGMKNKILEARESAIEVSERGAVTDSFIINATVVDFLESSTAVNRTFHLQALKEAVRNERLFEPTDIGFRALITAAKKGRDLVEKTPTEDVVQSYVSHLDALMKILEQMDRIAATDATLSTQAAPSTDWTELFVRIQRSGQDYYYPYSFARSGPAGNIELRHGDLVTVEQISETVLKQWQKVDSQSEVIFWRGNRISRGTVATIKQIRDQIESQALNSILLRRRNGNLQDNAIFVLPCESVHGVPFDDLRTLSDDSYEVISLLEIPLLRDSLIRDAAAGAVAANMSRIERRRPVLTEHEKKMRRLSEHHQNTSSRLSSMLSTFPLIP